MKYLALLILIVGCSEENKEPSISLHSCERISKMLDNSSRGLVDNFSKILINTRDIKDKIHIVMIRSNNHVRKHKKDLDRLLYLYNNIDNKLIKKYKLTVVGEDDFNFISILGD